MENLNGRKLVESGDTCERRNGCPSYIVYYYPLLGFLGDIVLIFYELCRTGS